MTLTLHFNGAALGAATSLDVCLTGKSPEVTERWLVELEVEAAAPAALEAALQGLRDAQGSSGELKLQADGADVRVLAVADCRLGPTLHAVTERERVPGQAHNRRGVTLEFRATLQDSAGAVQSHQYTVREVTAAGQPARLITRGLAILRRNENPANFEVLLLPMLGASRRRVRQLVTRDTAVPALEYEVEDEQVFTPLPGGVDDGHYVASEFIDTEGRALRALSGFFVGASARARALELRPASERLVSTRIAANPFTRRVDFEFVELLEEAGSLALTETLSFTTTRRVIDHPLLDTALPAYRQQVGAPQTEIIQQGSAVGDGRHVSPPAPRYAAELVERHVEYSLPHGGLPADRRWVTSWRYVSRGRAAMVELAPEV